MSASVGYMICNRIWPNFYFQATPGGKNAWLAAQGICTVVFVVGFFMAFAGVRKAANQVR